MSNDASQTPVVVAALYRFFRFSGYADFRAPLLNVCVEHGLKGTLLLAAEGINGTVAGSRSGIEHLRRFLEEQGMLIGMEYKESISREVPFNRMKVKLKREIVSMGIEGVEADCKTGVHLDPEQWNQVISDPDTLVIDTRNQYEFDIGTFTNAVSPRTRTFREFPAYVRENLDPERHHRIAMFCTGGIRCEKASAYLLQQGFREVYQLRGGILRYLENVKPEDNLWQGECFVFDGRVSVDDRLEQGSYEQCFACRRPVSDEDMRSDKYQQGISCPACYDELTQTKRERFSERQKQVDLAEQRGTSHIGAPQQQD